MTVEGATSIGGSKEEVINTVKGTSDGGYIVGGYFSSNEIQIDNETITNLGNKDGIIIKYNKEENIEWTKSIAGSGDEYIKTIEETNDGGYIVGGYFSSNKIQIGNEILTNVGSTDGILIKYNAEGDVEWAKCVGGNGDDYIESIAITKDGGYIAVGHFSSNIIQVGNEFLRNAGNVNGMMIKYNAKGNVEWTKNIVGSSNDYIKSIATTTDRGYIIGGYFSSNKIQIGNEILTNEETSNSKLLLIKYKENGETEWVKSNITPDSSTSKCYIETITETSDGGYMVGGYLNGKVQIGNVILQSKGYYYDDQGIIIKYDKTGEVKWARSIGGTNSDIVYSVTETRDRKYIVVGYFSGTSIQVGNETLVGGNYYGKNGFIISYNESGSVEWAKSIFGNDENIIYSVTTTNDNKIILGGYFTNSNIQIENETLTNSGNQDGMIIQFRSEVGVTEEQELVVENIRKEFKITTDVKEIDGIKGGTISGEDQKPYEIVKYGDSNTKEIKMIPEENYEIIAININGQEYKYSVLEDGSYTMPTLTNINEDKHIEVTYSLKDNKITINKVDSNTNEKLTGAKFKLDQIEERAEPIGVTGEMVENGPTYFCADTTNEITGVIGTLTKNGSYYFVEQNGSYIPTNGKTYQTSNGKTEGVPNSTANSYIPIDLTNKTGKYAVTVNARVSCENGSDYGYAIITESTNVPNVYTSTGKLMQIYGTKEAQDYTVTIEGGKVYYLHLAYYKDSYTDTGEDQIVFNSVNVYGTTSKKYGFTESNGKYENNNKGLESTIAQSYIPIDLTNGTGKYNLTVNAEVQSETYSNYGYISISEDATSTGNIFARLSGTTEVQDYLTVLEGGKMYYLHFVYNIYMATNLDSNTFTINSIEIALDDTEIYHTEVETNNDGQAITQIPFGKYTVTEIKAPNGYDLKETPEIIEFKADGEHEFTIKNTKSAQIIVHHYIKETTTKLAEDETIIGKIGEQYTTAPHLDIEKYELEKDDDGNYIIPENAKGTMTAEQIEVIYYYEMKPEFIEKPEIDNLEITKTSTTEKITEKNQNVPYVINYKAEIDLYTGKATITIIDQIENEIDVENSKLDGGIYDKVNKTITWVEEITEIDTFTNGKKAIEIEKQIELAYQNIDVTKKELTNTASGKVELEIPVDTNTITTTKKIPLEFLSDITINKVWSDNNNKYKKRPENIVVQLSGNEQTEDIILSTADKIDENTWSIIIEGKDRYNENGEEIEYKIDEKNIPEGYTKQVGTVQNIPETNNKEITITNTIVEIATEVEIKYIDKATQEEISEKVTKTGTLGEKYDITEDVKNITGYTLIEEPEEKTGTYTEEKQTKIYYYAKNSKVLVNYLDKETNKELAQQEIIEGYEGKSYETKEKTIENYILAEVTENKTGTMTREDIIVNYYYNLEKETTMSSVKVEYIDKATGELLDEEIHNGEIGDVVETKAKDFENYILIESPEEATVTITEEQKIVKYYYAHILAGVIERHVDEITGEILYSEEHKGNKGDAYKILSRTFEGYELVTEKQPDNAEGIMTETPIIVTYYYTKKSTGVIVKYIELKTKKVLEENKYEGKVGDKYETEQKEFEGYELVKTMLPNNATGVMKEEIIEVNYYYNKTYKVTVEYIDKANGEVMSIEEIIGTEGTKYETEIKEFKGYDLEKIPENKAGTIINENILVKYYYNKKAQVEVQYIDKETGAEILDKEIIEGHIGDKYETEQKDIQYYNFIESTTNTKGNMITEKTIVIYYYNKQVFNLKIDKWVENININGISQNCQKYDKRKEMYKLELNRKTAITSDVRITYKIRITNIGEIEGYAEKITEIIPKGFEFHQEDNKTIWIEEDGKLITTDLQSEAIEKDSYKEIEIVLRWKANENNFGEKDNTVELSKVRNPAGYTDVDKDNDIAKSKMLMTISTGLEENNIILIISGISIILAIVLVIIIACKNRI